MANCFFLTATKEFSFTGNPPWYSARDMTTIRYADAVEFNPNNGVEPFTIYPASQGVNIDGDLTKAAVGYFNPQTLVAAVQAVFPKGNSGSAGSGTITQNGTTYYMLSAADYTQIQNLLAVNNPSGT